jgi:actin-related protein 5
MFGENDEDWAIYRKIVGSVISFALYMTSFQNTTAPSSDEEDDLAQLEEIEQKLLLHDPAFTTEDTHLAMTTRRSALMSAFKAHYPDGEIQGSTVDVFLICLFSLTLSRQP